MRPGLRAAVYDPLWLLARQRQLGAFGAEDAATPVGVELSVQTTNVTHYRPGGPAAPSSATRSYDGSVPLEALVESEPPQREPGRNVRVAAEAGLRFLDFLSAHGAAALAPDYLDVYAIDPAPAGVDDATARFLRLVARRIPDGNKLHAAFHPPGTPAGQVVVPADPDATGFPGVAQAATDWLAWLEGVVESAHLGEDAWQRPRLEYAFAVAASERDGETVLAAREFDGDRLEWYSFDVVPEVSLGAGAGPAPSTVTTTALAAPIAYGGMPASRWFEFEDGAVNFGKLDAGPPDLARMLLLEYASLYGNDHFLVPVELAVGSLCRVTSLVVADNFGGRTQVRPSEEVATGDGAWQMFRLAQEGSTRGGSFLFLAPTLGNVIESAPLEDVLFLRDEMANMAWAVERVVEGPTGRPVDRFEAYQEERRRNGTSAQPPQTTAPLTYRVATRVPPHWIPLLPVSVSPGSHAVRLQLREMEDPETGTTVPPQGVLLDPAAGVLELFDEEVPRAGARVRRAYRYTRWTDGSVHLWIGRKKTPGRGEGSSGLRFDALEATPRGS
jgi:hypothetical protein